MEKFYESRELPQGINASFITLIPKTHPPLRIQDYRPISLINCSLKILLKLLAKRLKPTLHTLVLEVQHAFIKGRYISDCILVAGETAHSIQHNTKKDVILKVDFKKAFDSVRWESLINILNYQGFGGDYGYIQSFPL